jgi:hypothetical protein
MAGRWGQCHVVGESRCHVHGDHYARKVIPHIHTIVSGEAIRCDQAPQQHGSVDSQWGCEELATVLAQQPGVQLGRESIRCV